MGEVWRARDLRLDRPVAVKHIRPAAQPGGERSSRRVLAEARAAARISSPAVVAVYDAFEDGGDVYIVMELIEAPTLHTRVATDGPLVPTDAALLGTALAGALATAHDLGVVHRDVKPANVLVPAPARPKLADFGIASITDDTSVTTRDVVIGSIGYMSPEQASGERVTAATDVWSLGATLYYAVEGEAPFRRDTTPGTLMAIVREPPRPPAHAGALSGVLVDMLRKDPARRPTIDAVAERLRAVTSGTAVVAPSAGAPTAVVGALPTTRHPRVALPVDTAPRPTAPPRRRSRTAIAVVLVLALLAIGAVAAAIGHGATSADSPTTSSTAVATTAPVTTAPPPPTTAPPPPEKGKGRGHGHGDDGE
jgi:serine/threonine protein kinase